jgi:hypothetical protein
MDTHRYRGGLERAGATGFVTGFVRPYTMAVKAKGKAGIIDFTATFSPLSGGRLSMGITFTTGGVRS